MCDIAGESRASYGTVAASVMRTVESLISSPGRWRERALGELINLSDVRGLRRAYTSSLVRQEFEWHEAPLTRLARTVLLIARDIQILRFNFTRVSDRDA